MKLNERRQPLGTPGRRNGEDGEGGGGNGREEVEVEWQSGE